MDGPKHKMAVVLDCEAVFLLPLNKGIRLTSHLQIPTSDVRLPVSVGEKQYFKVFSIRNQEYTIVR